MDVAAIIQSGRSFGRKETKDIEDADIREQVLNLQEIARSALTTEEGDEGGRSRVMALVRERDLLVIGGLLVKLLKQLQESVKKLLESVQGTATATADGKGGLDKNAILLAECVFLVCYTVQCTRDEALAVRDCSTSVAIVNRKLEEEAARGNETFSTPRLKSELTSIGHLLFLSWTCALDRSRYRDSYDPRTGTFDVNALLRDDLFIRDSRKELDVSLAAMELVGCVFRLATADPDEDEDAVTGPLRVCVGERKALEYLARDLPDWLEHSSAVLSQDLDLYTDALEDLAIDIAEAPTLCSVLVDFTQEAANSAAASFISDGTLTAENGGQIPPEGSNLTAALADLFARSVAFSPNKVAFSRSVYGGLRYLSGANSGGGALQRIGDAVIDLGDAAMRDPDAPGGVGRIFSDALKEFLRFMEACAGVSVPYAAAVTRYLTEAGHPMASLERLEAALSFYTQALQSGANAELNPAEAAVLAGLLSVVATCASVLHGQGDFLALIGVDFPMRVAALAVLEIPPLLKATSVEAVGDFRDAAGISAYLESATADRCAGLAREINSVEAAVGHYVVTSASMNLCVKVLKEMVSVDDVERGIIPSPVEAMTLFALEHVLSHWGRRQYRDEEERWKVAAEAAELVFEARKSVTLVATLLLPAPGTGGSCAALRALAAIAGLRRSADLEGAPAGAEALAKASENGQGECVKLMERAATIAAKVLTHLLSIPTSQLRRTSVSAMNAGTLLLTEQRSVIDAGSLISDDSELSASAALYLAKLISVAPPLARKIVTDPSASSLRMSLATVIADVEGNGEDAKQASDEPSPFESILQLISACLESGNAPDAAYFLLGISVDERSEPAFSYGVLAGLCDKIRCAKRLDDRQVATAASFVAFLAGSSTGQLSMSVLEFLRTSDAGSCASTTLARVLVEVQPNEGDELDWNSLARLVGACMRIAALESRLYPDEELSDDSLSDRGAELHGLLRVLARIARNDGKHEYIVGAFDTWRQLLSASATRLHQDGRLNSTTLYEIASEVLEGLAASVDGDIERLVHTEGSSGAASVVLLCISLLREPVRDGVTVDLSQAGMILEKTVRAITGPLGSKPDGLSARTALYAALMHAYQLVESFAGSELELAVDGMKATGGVKSARDGVNVVLARAVSARVGRRQWAGAEGLVAVASGDACTGSAAARAAAMNAIACILKMDMAGASLTGGALSALAALCGQNRLRKVGAAALADPEAARKISQICNGRSDQGSEATSDCSAAVFVAESALVLLHAVANIPGGARAISDAGVVESAAFLASTISTGRTPEMGLTPERRRNGDLLSDAMSKDFDRGGENDLPSAVETRAGLAGMIAGLAAASLRKRGGFSRSDTALASPAVGVLESSQVIFAELIRGLKEASISQLNAAASVGLLLCRLPSDLINVGASSLLVNLCARFVWFLFHSRRERAWSGGEPRTVREARRAQVTHPEGASLFERDLAYARMHCARACLTAVRASPALLSFFSASLATSRESTTPGSKTSLGDVVDDLKIVLGEMSQATEEEMRITANLSGVSRRLPSLRAFILEEFGLSGSNLSGDALEQCMRKTAGRRRAYAERICAPVVETLLFILREYTRTAREKVRGTHLSSATVSLSPADADAILIDGRNSLLSVCREIDSIGSTLWGTRDMSFTRQLSRQIRTYLTEK